MQMLKNYRTILLAACIFLVGFMTFSPSLQGPFFFDDEFFIVRNQLITDLANFTKIYSSSVTEGSYISGNFYRPNQQLVYAFLYQIFGLTSATPYHMVALFFHLINSVLLFNLLRKFNFTLLFSTFGALFFTLHPAQTEAVSYISGFADPLALFFILVGLHSTLKFIQVSTIFNAVVPALSLVMALLSKESGVVFLPLVIFTTLYFTHTRKIPLSRRHLIFTLMLTLITGSYLILKFTAFNFSATIGLTNQQNFYTEQLSVRLITFINILWDYLKLILLPIDLYYEKPYKAYTSLITFRSLCGFAVLALSCSVLLRFRKFPQAALALVFFWAAITPFTGIIALNAIFLEHWLYVPMLGISMLFALSFKALLTKAPTQLRKNLVITLFSLVLILYAARSFLRASEWGDIEKFYLNELIFAPESVRMRNNLGMHYADQKDYTKAIEQYEEAIKSLTQDTTSKNIFPQPYHNVANLYFIQKNYRKAVDYLLLALDQQNDFVYSLILLQNVLVTIGAQSEAQETGVLLAAVLRGEKSYDYLSYKDKIYRKTQEILH